MLWWNAKKIDTILPCLRIMIMTAEIQNENCRWIHHIIWEVILMKIVVVKSPKMLSGILRLMFGIKKEA